MEFHQLSTPADVSPTSIIWAVGLYGKRFHAYPKTLVIGWDWLPDPSETSPANVMTQAAEFGLNVCVLPPAYSESRDAWAVCGDEGTIWSPGA